MKINKYPLYTGDMAINKTAKNLGLIGVYIPVDDSQSTK